MSLLHLLSEDTLSGVSLYTGLKTRYRRRRRRRRRHRPFRHLFTDGSVRSEVQQNTNLQASAASLLNLPPRDVRYSFRANEAPTEESWRYNH